MKTIFRNVPKRKMSTFRHAADFYAHKLMSKRLLKNLMVKIEFIDGLSDKTSEGGNCIWSDDYIRPREFEIQLDKSDDFEYMLTALAHEMVHVKQWATGEMKEVWNQNEACKWLGNVIDTAKTEYWDYPWEIEAHGRERGLYVRFCEESGYDGK
tara:strand:- start:8700 stop:9161 length:462 start_codon:yes stop_codon:yes gene_type:complete